jgi:DNA invertase Pin-like site-specific DNA recombinase
MDALSKAKCDLVFTEKCTGATTARPALKRCLEELKPGDTLIVWKLDRLGRSLRDLITMPDDLRDRGVKFRSLTEAIDTETPTGRATWQRMGVLAASAQHDRGAHPRRCGSSPETRHPAREQRTNPPGSGSSTPASYGQKRRPTKSPVFLVSAAAPFTGRLHPRPLEH